MSPLLLDSETQAFKTGHFMKFGYARVSSNTQDHAAQVEALKAAGCERIYSGLGGINPSRCGADVKPTDAMRF